MKMADETIEIEFHIGDTVVLEGKTKNAAYNLKQWGCNTYEIESIRNSDLLVRSLTSKDFRWVSPDDAKYRILKRGE